MMVETHPIGIQTMEMNFDSSIWRTGTSYSYPSILNNKSCKMESLVEGPSDEGGTAVTLSHLVSNTTWATQTPVTTNSNSTLHYIAVEYVKGSNDFKIDSEGGLSAQQAAYNDFEQHVSPLDPNMSSVARYSPVYTDASVAFNNSVVVHQLVSAAENNQNHQSNFVTSLSNSGSLETISTTLSNTDLRQVVNNRYLQMVNGEENVSTDTSPTDGIRLVPDTEQEVELLITDQATVVGISFNVGTQEFLVERCLDDEQQLLDALAPGPLLDTELLALDENTLKSQLPDIVDAVSTSSAASDIILSNQAPDISITAVCPIKQEKQEAEKNENLRRSQRQNGIIEYDNDEQLLSGVYTITDKPVPTRARATLPESYLQINKIGDDEYEVIARKLIPKRTQFGPLEGIIVKFDEMKVEDNKLDLLIEYENGVIKRLDISDENTANWMRFVRRATSFDEQNLVLSQQGLCLFYTTTKNILPKQELMVGYSASYANKHNLPFLKLPSDIENAWPCFECSQRFPTSEQLQKHLNIHDDNKNENTKPRKKCLKNKRKLFMKKFQKMESLECNICKETFQYPKYNVLKRHLSEHGLENNLPIQDKFSVIRNWKCDDCNVWFDIESLLKIHNLQHDIDNFEDEQTTNVCPSCQKKFATQKQLVSHVSQHAFSKTHEENSNSYKCPICHKMFASRERIQRHMLVHGSEESKPLQCSTCSKRFLNNSALACHLKTHYVGKKIFECPMCKESFDHVLQLKEHVPKHCENGQYTCPYCKKIFKKYSIIRKHIRAFHCERKHNCPDCSKPFPTLDKLRMHLLRHSDHREFLCADCGKQFKRKDKLKEHCKRMHSEERENDAPKPIKQSLQPTKKFTPRVQPTDYHRFIYKCHACLVGFKRRGMLVNHLAKRHPDISPDSVPELNLPILRTTRDYYCQYCDKVYKSSSKRKAHILKNHPGAALPMSNRRQGSCPEVAGLPNPTFSQTVGSVTTHPQGCQWCHKQYASKAKLLQHQRKKHTDLLQQQTINEAKSTKYLQQSTSTQQNQVEEITIDAHCFKRDFKVSDEEFLSEIVELSDEKGDSTYYHLVSVTSDNSFSQPTELGGSDSRLYRLLTTGAALVPPR